MLTKVKDFIADNKWLRAVLPSSSTKQLATSGGRGRSSTKQLATRGGGGGSRIGNAVGGRGNGGPREVGEKNKKTSGSTSGSSGSTSGSSKKAKGADSEQPPTQKATVKELLTEYMVKCKNIARYEADVIGQYPIKNGLLTSKFTVR